MATTWVGRTLLRSLYYGYHARAFLRRRTSSHLGAQANRSEFYELIWSEAAHALGATLRRIGHGVLEIRRGSLVTRVRQNCTTMDDAITLALAGNKPLTYRLFADCGVRVPRYAEFTLDEVQRAARFLREAKGECVVKPAADTGGGLGVTTGIQTSWQLARAAANATVYGNDLLIQEQVPGDNYRLLYLDGMLLDAVVQKPPTVKGDGRSPVRSLVRQANTRRLEKGACISQGLLSVDPDMRQTLDAQGLKLSSVPREGQTVVLKTAINENMGEDNRTATAMLCQSIIDEVALASRTVGARLAGVDIITTNPSVPLRESGGAIIEVNTTPGFYWHYQKADGPFPVAYHVLQFLMGGEDDWNERQTSDQKFSMMA